MIRLRNALFLMLAAMTASVHAAPARHHRPAAVDWTRTVIATPDGGFRMGNPKAKVALVEYFSFTCPHCAAFVGEALPTIRDQYVRAGTLSFEMRPAVRDRADYVAVLLSRCGGPARFFATAEAIFAAQGDWETRAIDYDSGHRTDFQAADAATAMAALAHGAGLDAIAAQHGVPSAALARCFADAKAQAIVKASTEAAWGTRKIGGTPAFLVNDALLGGVYDWAGLQARLADALNG